ncbi:MAG: DUF721 domain-containing protein, partial [Magnetococcales bacterium]|nr:DUF721 domain-containing protein [Magnetococcales bacterium]
PLWRYWNQAVGLHMARHSELVFFSGGVLTVRVDAPVWAQEMSFLKEQIIVQLNKATGVGGVRALRIQQGTLQRLTPRAKPKPPVSNLPDPTSEELMAAESLVAVIQDPELRETARLAFVKLMVAERTPL